MRTSSVKMICHERMRHFTTYIVMQISSFASTGAMSAWAADVQCPLTIAQRNKFAQGQEIIACRAWQAARRKQK